jgi:nucleotide-binding universal stress UspA family protein
VPSSPIDPAYGILFATDFSETSRRALLYVKKLAQRRGAAVRGIHVIDLTEEAGRDESSFSAARRSAERMLREVRRELRLAGLHESALLIAAGKPAQAILETLSQYKLSMLAIGVRGTRSGQSTALGSTALMLLQAAPCPVLTVGAGCPPYPGTGAVERVLLVTDAMPESLRAAREAWPESKTKAATVFVVKARRNLRLAGALARDSETIRVLDPEGAGEAILLEAQRTGTELIVVGRAGGRYLDSFGKDALAHRLATEAPCPVLWART